jgi:hypothetical protein
MKLAFQLLHHLKKLPAELRLGPAGLPAFATSAWFLTLLWPVLQLILLACNLRAYHLVAGEMDGIQRDLAAWAGLLNAANILLGAVCCLPPWGRRRLLSPAGLGLWLASQAGYLWWFCVYGFRLMPDSVAFWILSETEVIGQIFILTMPSVFVGLLLLATWPLPLTPGKDIGLSCLALLGPPVFFYALIQAVATLGIGAYIERLTLLLVLLFIAATALLFFGLFRLLLWGMRWVAAYAWAEWVLLAGLGLVAPLGGLWLNRHIPFPYDFQSTAVYALAVLNGLVLLLPLGVGRRLSWLGWVGGCLSFPFTLYFFLVFVPFFPLAIPAVLAAGAGFLILAPAGLFFVHAEQLRRRFRVLCGAGFSARAVAAAGILAFLAVPAAFLEECVEDRVQIRRALEYAYHGDTSKELRFAGDPHSVARCLERLRDRKAGLWLPGISNAYNAVVFDGLVLPDGKMKDLYRLFTGRELSMEIEKDGMMSDLWGGGRSAGDRRRGPVQADLPQQVAFDSLVESRETEGAFARTTWSLRMTNPGAGQDEFVLRFFLQPGAAASGLKLKIGDLWVDGRMFERKAALWVYERIRDQRRDPALLSYVGPDLLELRVFPLAAKETREVQIEFLHPAGMEPARGLSAQPARWEKVPPEEEGKPLVADTEAGRIFWLPESEVLDSVVRRPYLHLLADRSSAHSVTPAQVRESLRSLRARFPEAGKVRISWVNLAEVEEGGSPGTMGEMDQRLAALQEAPLPARDGFNWEGALIKSWHDRRGETGGALPAAEWFPVYAVVSPQKPDAAAARRIGERLAREQPDFPAIGWGVSETWQWLGPEGGQPCPALRPVLRFVREGVPAFLPEEGGPKLVVLENRPRVLPADSGAPRTGLEKAWIGAMGLLARAELEARNPFRQEEGWRERVAASKASGILLPDTAYIVVENSAQWRKLEEMERLKLRGEKELEIVETPEPGAGILAALFGLYLLARALRRKPSVREDVSACLPGA